MVLSFRNNLALIASPTRVPYPRFLRFLEPIGMAFKATAIVYRAVGERFVNENRRVTAWMFHK